MSVHLKESNEDTQKHLDENRHKFDGDYDTIHRILKTGRRLSNQDVRDMKLEDRRLRDIFNDGNCSKEWVMKENGKRSHVEYFIPGLKPPTKKEVIAKAEAAVKAGKQHKTINNPQITNSLWS